MCFSAKVITIVPTWWKISNFWQAKIRITGFQVVMQQLFILHSIFQILMTCGSKGQHICESWFIQRSKWRWMNWRAPCKPALNDYFVAIFQVAPNRLKFGMSTLFVLKTVPVFFFHKRGSKASNTFLKVQPPPPPSRTPLPPPLNLPPIA